MYPFTQDTERVRWLTWLDVAPFRDSLNCHHDWAALCHLFFFFFFVLSRNYKKNNLRKRKESLGARCKKQNGRQTRYHA